ncbi:Cytochrome P450 [Mycena sanguinolenta]|uniref:Cytochrome P450 n=1 Tax=Mycena sanguinolenta TaxID=230812 RepID=A0A8H6XU43_9AGAR|nr:Cytochrome P450 [Mycena sanguinolenta]
MAFEEYLLPVGLPLLLVAAASLLRKPKATLPPGPKPKLLIGNLFDVPTQLAWLTYTKWRKQYGDLVFFGVFGNNFLILNSLKATTDLLDKRATIYSERPSIPSIRLMGWEFSFSFMSHTDKWRGGKFVPFDMSSSTDETINIIAQKIVSSALSPRRSSLMLHNLLTTPEDFLEHVEQLTTAIIMAMVYGYDIKSLHDDPIVHLQQESIKRLSESAIPGRFMVNVFPFLRHVPAWFPGAGFHQFFKDTVKLVGQMKQAPFDFVKQNMQSGSDRQSVLRELLEHNEAHGGSVEREEDMKDIAGVAYAAAAETTTATLMVSVMALAMHPEVVRKAQAELDAVVGLGSLPGFEHRSELPYCEAVVREIFRWRPITPVAIAHATHEDDVYDGYLIPKGTIILPNVWAMVHDETMYPDPDTFKPERFLNADGTLNSDDLIIGFGFGRRICAGRHAADATLWAATVSLLATFNIGKAKDAAGKEIEIEDVFTDGMVSYPKPFKCSITPRNELTKQLVSNINL